MTGRLGDQPESVVDAVVVEIPFDGRGAIGEGEDGWKFDELELVQGIAIGWEKSFELWIVGRGEVGSFGEGPTWQVGRDHCKEISYHRGFDAIELGQGSQVGRGPHHNVCAGCIVHDNRQKEEKEFLHFQYEIKTRKDIRGNK